MNYYESYGLQGLGDAAQVSAGVASGAGVVGSAAGIAIGSGLITAGSTLAATVPVVGWIAGAIAIAAGFIAKAQGKAKAIKNERFAIQDQNIELYTLTNDLDAQIIEVNGKKAAIVGEIKSKGLGGLGELGSLKTFFQKVFTPAKLESGKLEDAQRENTRLLAEIDSKITNLKTLQSDLQAMYTKLTTGSSSQNIILYTAGGITALGLGYLAYSYFSQPSK